MRASVGGRSTATEIQMNASHMTTSGALSKALVTGSTLRNAAALTSHERNQT
jgi:hypothetical protein